MSVFARRSASFLFPSSHALHQISLRGCGWYNARLIAAVVSSPRTLGSGAAASTMPWGCPSTFFLASMAAFPLCKLTEKEALEELLIWHSCNLAGPSELGLLKECLYAWDFCKGQNLGIRDSLFPANNL